MDIRQLSQHCVAGRLFARPWSVGGDIPRQFICGSRKIGFCKGAGVGLFKGGLGDAVLEFEEVDVGYCGGGDGDSGFGVIGERLGGFGEVFKTALHRALVFGVWFFGNLVLGGGGVVAT